MQVDWNSLRSRNVLSYIYDIFNQEKSAFKHEEESTYYSFENGERAAKKIKKE
jgi:hypothetical protein